MRNTKFRRNYSERSLQLPSKW